MPGKLGTDLRRRQPFQPCGRLIECVDAIRAVSRKTPCLITQRAGQLELDVLGKGMKLIDREPAVLRNVAMAQANMIGDLVFELLERLDRLAQSTLRLLQRRGAGNLGFGFLPRQFTFRQ